VNDQPDRRAPVDPAMVPHLGATIDVERRECDHRCAATNDANERCIYGRNHKIEHHRFGSELAGEITEDVL
jgi:hypothetical protein